MRSVQHMKTKAGLLLHVYVCMCYSDSVNLDNNTEAWCCYYNVSNKCSVCMGSGRARDEGWGERRAFGRLGDVCGGGGGGRSVHCALCKG